MHHEIEGTMVKKKISQKSKSTKSKASAKKKSFWFSSKPLALAVIFGGLAGAYFIYTSFASNSNNESSIIYFQQDLGGFTGDTRQGQINSVESINNSKSSQGVSRISSGSANELELVSAGSFNLGEQGFVGNGVYEVCINGWSDNQSAKAIVNFVPEADSKENSFGAVVINDIPLNQWTGGSNSAVELGCGTITVPNQDVNKDIFVRARISGGFRLESFTVNPVPPSIANFEEDAPTGSGGWDYYDPGTKFDLGPEYTTGGKKITYVSAEKGITIVSRSDVPFVRGRTAYPQQYRACLYGWSEADNQKIIMNFVPDSNSQENSVGGKVSEIGKHVFAPGGTNETPEPKNLTCGFIDITDAHPIYLRMRLFGKFRLSHLEITPVSILNSRVYLEEGNGTPPVGFGYVLLDAKPEDIEITPNYTTQLSRVTRAYTKPNTPAFKIVSNWIPYWPSKYRSDKVYACIYGWAEERSDSNIVANFVPHISYQENSYGGFNMKINKSNPWENGTTEPKSIGCAKLNLSGNKNHSIGLRMNVKGDFRFSHVYFRGYEELSKDRFIPNPGENKIKDKSL